MAYLSPCTGFEEPITVLAAMGITTIIGSDAIVTTSERHINLAGNGGAQSLQCNNGSHVSIVINGSSTTHIHLKMLVPDNGDGALDFQFRIDGDENCIIRLNPNRSIVVVVGTIVVARSIRQLVPGWHLLEFEVLATAAGRVRVWVDRDATAFADTGAGFDCQNEPNPGFDQMVIEVPNDNDYYFDDLIVADATTGRATKEWYIPMVRPTANGTTIQLTPVGGANHANVSETGAPNLATYNETSTPGQLDRYLHGAAPWTPQNIMGISPVALVTRDGTITQGRTTIKSGAATADGTYATLGGAATYSAVSDVFDVDPNTSATWATIAAVNASEDGVQFT